jgi:hypothetical protein
MTNAPGGVRNSVRNLFVVVTGPLSVNVDPSGRFLYVANSQADTFQYLL